MGAAPHRWFLRAFSSCFGATHFTGVRQTRINAATSRGTAARGLKNRALERLEFTGNARNAIPAPGTTPRPRRRGHGQSFIIGWEADQLGRSPATAHRIY